MFWQASIIWGLVWTYMGFQDASLKVYPSLQTPRDMGRGGYAYREGSTRYGISGEVGEYPIYDK